MPTLHCTGNNIKSVVSMMHSLCLQFVHSTVCAILSASYKSTNLDQETFMEEQAYNNALKHFTT